MPFPRLPSRRLETVFNYPNKTKLTLKEIESFPQEDGKQVTIYDTTLTGFALRIGKTSKTFIVYKRVAHGLSG